jgi:uncharacterized membrane protein
MKHTRKLVFCALLASAALAIGYAESLFPLPLPSTCPLHSRRT